MNLEHLELRNWTTHKVFVQDFPAKGVILVTGANGTGKSSIAEAVACAGWGESLRGKLGWSDKPGQLLMRVDGLTIDRRRKGATTKLQFGTETYDTASKAQDALSHVLGDFDVWRRSSVFSSRDPANFSTATDAERKRLIESILDLTKLDKAAELCRKDLRMQSTAADRAASVLAAREATLTGTVERIHDVERNLAELEAEEDEELGEIEDLDTLRDEVAQCAAYDEAGVSTHLEELSERIVDMRAKLQTAHDRHTKLQRLGQCPTCTQLVPKALKDAAAHELHDVDEELSEALTSAKAEHAGLTTALSNHHGDKRELEKRLHYATERAGYAARRAKKIANAKEALRKLEASRQDAHDDVDAAVWDGQQATSKAGTLKQVERVLSTTGVRAHLLGSSLSFIEQTANDWLERITGERMRLKLTPYAEKASGGTQDRIGMEIEGAGGGLGYKAASGGERQRLDIALMLGLAEVNAAAHGVQPGTLFFDECFDSLDLEGVQSVCGVIDQLADSRCVVLISHNEDVVKGVRNVAGQIKL